MNPFRGAAPLHGMTTSATSILNPTESAAWLREHPRARLVDVRTPAEYETAHIPGAYNIPLDALGAHLDAIRNTVADPIVLVCRSGQRSRQAEQMLEAAGLGTCLVLDGGLDAWAASGLPVERGRQRISLERQVRIAAGALAAIGGLLATFAHSRFGLLPAFVGSGLVFAGLTDTCGMGMALSRLPYNRPRGTDTAAVVRALQAGNPPDAGSAGVRSGGGAAASCCG